MCHEIGNPFVESTCGAIFVKIGSTSAYFEGDNNRDIVVSAKLAELLEVTLGNRIVVTVAQSESGDLSQEMFRISGIYHLGGSRVELACLNRDPSRKMS